MVILTFFHRCDDDLRFFDEESMTMVVLKTWTLTMFLFFGRFPSPASAIQECGTQKARIQEANAP